MMDWADEKAEECFYEDGKRLLSREELPAVSHRAAQGRPLHHHRRHSTHRQDRKGRMGMSENETPEWQTMETAPRDGTPVDLCWMENGKVAESYGPMVWNQFANNAPFQNEKGIWACHGRDGRLLFTWSESHPDGAPQFWRFTHHTGNRAG